MSDAAEATYQRAHQRAILLLTTHFAGADARLGQVVVDEISEMLPQLPADSREFSELMNLLACLTSWVAAGVESDAEAAGRPPLEMLAEFAEFLREPG